LVVGYATGDFDQAAGQYVVAEDQAHSWPEVFFPDFGWILFEPTPARPALERPAGAFAGIPQQAEPPFEPIMTYRLRAGLRQALEIGCVVILLFLVSAAGWRIIDAVHLRHLPPYRAIASMYRRLQRHGAKLGVPAQLGDTTSQFAHALEGHLGWLAQGRRRSSLLSSAPGEVHRLSDLTTWALYSGQAVTPVQRGLAIHVWRRLAPKLWLARVLTGMPGSGRRSHVRIQGSLRVGNKQKGAD
jgi:hypothetical protein